MSSYLTTARFACMHDPRLQRDGDLENQLRRRRLSMTAATTPPAAPRGVGRRSAGYAFTNVNYSSNTGTTVPAGNGTTFGYFIDHLLLGGTGPASHVTTWNQTLDRGVVKMTYLVSLTANTTYSPPDEDTRIILFGVSAPPALGLGRQPRQRDSLDGWTGRRPLSAGLDHRRLVPPACGHEAA